MTLIVTAIVLQEQLIINSAVYTSMKLNIYLFGISKMIGLLVGL